MELRIPGFGEEVVSVGVSLSLWAELAYSNAAQAILVEEGNARAIVRLSGTRAVVAVAGSNDVWDWAQNVRPNTAVLKLARDALGDAVGVDIFDFSPQSDWVGVTVHAGFFEHARLLKKVNDIVGRRDTWYVGHSLGGAVASILAYAREEHGTRSRVVTFAQPSFCLKGNYDIETTRWVVPSDLIPRVKLRGYRHVGTEMVLLEDSIKLQCSWADLMRDVRWKLANGGNVAAHSMATYRRRLRRR